eukprot:SAG22_NODE_113_length_19407_cov_214.925161_4_plen_326_part_00
MKNELYDFLDSINWAAVCQSVRDLHDEKTSGRLADGAHLMLEIVCKDSPAHRAQTQAVKDKVKRALRFEELEREHFISRRKQRRRRAIDSRSKSHVKTLGKRAFTSLFGQKVSSSVDLLASSDGMSTSQMNSSMWMSNDQESDAETAAAGSSCCCFGSQRPSNEAAAEKNSKEAKARHLERQRQRKLQRKLLAEKDVRFNIEFAGILPENLHTPVAREKKRYQLLLKSHQKELALVAPHFVEVDIDSDEYHRQNWDKGHGHTIQGRKKGRLRNFVTKKKDSKQMTMSSVDGGSNMMVITNPDFANQGMQASNDEQVRSQRTVSAF